MIEDNPFKRDLDRALSRHVEPVLERHGFHGKVILNIRAGGTVGSYEVRALHEPSEGHVSLREVKEG